MMPGKRVKASRIRNIDPRSCTGFNHIFILSGINDLTSYRPNVGECFSALVDKLQKIQKLCPTSRITVAPILPTKSKLYNDKALEFNSMLFDYSLNNPSIGTLQFDCFCDQNTSLLAENMARFKKPHDLLHLGSSGIFKLSRLIRDKVFGNYNDGRLYSGVADPSKNNAAKFHVQFS